MSSFKFTDAAQKTLSEAVDLAREQSNSFLSPIHLAAALLSPSDNGSSLFKSILDKAGANTTKFEQEVTRACVRLPAQDPPPDDIAPNNALTKVLSGAQSVMKDMKDSFIAQDHLILALVKDSNIEPLLKQSGSSVDNVKKAADQVRGGRNVNSSSAEEGFEALSKYAVDLTAEAAAGKIDPVIGRDNEIRRCIRILSRRAKNNPVLIGDPGVGKTAIAEGLARRIIERDVPVNLIGRLYSLDMGSVTAGASYKGQFEERIKSVLDEIEKSDENIILFIDEVHTLMADQKSGNGIDAANLLKPALARGKLRCIGATTLNEYRQHIEKDAAFERRFQQVIVNEPSVPETISILRGIRERYENHHGVEIMDSAMVSAATLAHRYLTSRKLPDSAIDLIDEAAAAVHVARDSQPEQVDRLERAKMQLEVEVTALNSELKRSPKDESIKARLAEAQGEIAKIDDELKPLKAEFEAEKKRTDEITSIRRRIDQLKSKADNAERQYDLATAADLRHYAIPQAEKRLEVAEQEKKDRETSGTSMIGNIVTPEAIQQVVAQWTGIPVASLKSTEKEKLLKIEKYLRKEVIGQPEAVHAVANAIRLSRSGLSNQDRPIASFLFVGPSGTGKTLLTKSLAKFLFDSADAMIRIDASEYSEKYSISRLIGSPPGYVGHDEGGQLTEYVRRKPYSVILIDELEKACREFHTLFLQVLDDGRLTDSQGRVVSFRNSVIIMTSNIGASYLNDLPEPDVKNPSIPPDARALVDGAIRASLPPEFINRIDSIIMFNRLTRANVRDIVNVRIDEIQRRLRLNGRDITLDLDKPALDYLGDTGYNVAYGARPLNRAIQAELLNPLSRLLISESIRDGEQAHVHYSPQANALVVVPNHAPIAGYDDDEDMDVDDDDDIVEVD